jgi:hypothetical protein
MPTTSDPYWPGFPGVDVPHLAEQGSGPQSLPGPVGWERSGR